MKYPSFERITFQEAEKREAFLRRHPAICCAVNLGFIEIGEEDADSRKD
jgi:hypothetical protein